MYKLVKYAIDKEYGNCLTPCPYGLEGFGQIMVASGSCQDCKHHKGKVKKQVKCSFEYEMKDQEPSEIKTEKVTSSDCGSDCVCKEEVKKTTDTYDKAFEECKSSTVTALYVKSKQSKEEVKSCFNCHHKTKPSSSNPCSTCMVGEHTNWKSIKIADEKPKAEKVKKEKSCRNCGNFENECEENCFVTRKNWRPKVKKYKYVCKSCFGIGKCTLISEDVGRTNPQCPYGKMAKWKLKAEA